MWLYFVQVEKIEEEYKFIYLLSRKEHVSSDFEILVSPETIPVKGSSQSAKIRPPREQRENNSTRPTTSHTPRAPPVRTGNAIVC